ncbi:MAG: GAF domain-containing protein [Planctomycetaceae bacterium]|jgi:CheY-like chemotaxis protein|nr:GAF domain-containing protein [Planctomycetaceae bacterium]
MQSIDAVPMSEQPIEQPDGKSAAEFEHILLANITTAIVYVDLDQRILWCNQRFSDWMENQSPVGEKFFSVLKRPKMLGPDFLPFSKVKRSGLNSMTVLEMPQGVYKYIRMGVGPVFNNDNGKVEHYVVSLQNVTDQTIREEKWAKLRQAGRELADLSRKDLLQRSPKERTNLLRAKIAKYAQEILKFASVEIRVKSESNPNLLEPLFALGMAEEARLRTLYINQDGNGITGWVAYHGKSYRMDDSSDDPFFIEGVVGARSSLTVPLLCRGEVIGTFNVESQHPAAFDDNDLLLLETFASDIALAIHTLELLSVEQKETAFRSIEKVFSDSIVPLNLILNETARLPIDDFKEHPEQIDADDIMTAFIRIRESTRQIQSAFQEHIAALTTDIPPELSSTDCANYPMLRDKRVLLADSDESVGKELSRLLFYYGCTVESSTTGFGALKMLEATRYDAFMCDIKLPDMSAFTFFKQVRCIYCKRFDNRSLYTICEPPAEDPCCPEVRTRFIPFVYMRSFGYDSGHVTTRAAQAGVQRPIFKPFILTQLLETLKTVIEKAAAPEK